MLLQNAFSALNKSEIQEGLQGIGVDVFDKDDMLRDMGDIFKDLQSKLNGMSDKKKSNTLEGIGLIDVQAKNAFALLTGDTNKLRQSLDATNNSMGATQRALELTDNPARTFKDTLDKINAALTYLGYIFLPIVNTVLGGFNSAMGWILQNGDMIKSIMEGLAVTAGTLALRYVWLTRRMLILNAQLALVTLGQWLLNIAMSVNPVVAIITVIGLLATAFYAAYKSSATFRGMLAGIGAVAATLFDVFVGLGKVMLGTLTFNPKLVAEGVQQAAGAVSEIASKGISGIFNEAKDKVISDELKSETPEKMDDKDKDKKDNKTNSLGDVVTGGAQSKTLTINIQKLNENIVIHSSSVKESKGDIERQLTELLLRVIRNTETAY